MKRKLFIPIVAACMSVAALSHAKVSEQEAKRLDQELNPMGGERAGNKAGTIPAWGGTMTKPASGSYKPGDVWPDPYADEKPLFVITKENMAKYAENLSEGQKALLQRYPNTFKIPVYPTHRDGRYNKLIEDRTRWNATHTELVGGPDGLRQYTGGLPFPIPTTPAEYLWNGRASHFTPTMDAKFDDIAAYPDGNLQQRRQTQVADFPFSLTEHALGTVDEKIDAGGLAARMWVDNELPVRDKGMMTIVHEPFDQVTYSRNAWVYMPGSRRVRRAPTVGYDTPDGPGGLVTVDDTLGFNGATDRYELKLVGKKEVYIPYHTYKFDSPSANYKTLLTTNHANPDFMRYELHRVWVVEANLKAGARHIYAKRRWYMDEDTWQIALLESYDGRGDLWRVGLLNSLYEFGIQSYIDRNMVMHDLNNGAYVATRLINETRPPIFTNPPKGADFFSPQNLRKMAKR